MTNFNKGHTYNFLTKIILLITLSALYITPCHAHIYETDISFNHLKKKDGLSDNLIFSIFQDSKGYMWIGTSNGLNRYDGYNFKKFHHDPENSGSIGHNVITWICEDNNKNLWFATYGGGISMFIPEKNEFRNYTLEPDTKHSISSQIINHIMCDSEGTLWISTKSDGINLFYPSSGKFINFRNNPEDPDSLSSNKVMYTFEDSSGTIWIATWGEGLCKYNKKNNTFQRIHPKSGSEKNICCKFLHTITEDQEMNLWMGTGSNGLVKYNKFSEEFTNFGSGGNNNVNLTDRKINTIFLDTEDNNLIWIGTDKGLYAYQILENKFILFNKNESGSGLNNEYIWSIIRDRSGLLWIGTVGVGINLEKRGYEHFKKISYSKMNNRGLSSAKIGAIYGQASEPSILWIGTLGGGLNKFDLQTGTRKVYNTNNSGKSPISSNNITYITSDPLSPEILFIGTGSGLNKYDIKQNLFLKFRSPKKELDSFNSAFISSILISPFHKGLLWISTFDNGLFKLDTNKNKLKNYFFEHKSNKNPNPNRVYTMKYINKDSNTIWIGTNTGLGKFDTSSGKFKFFQIDHSKNSISSNIVLSIYESKSEPGILWIGTYGGGLNRFDTYSMEFSKFTKKEGLPDNTILSISEEPRGHLWLTTLNGISRFDINTGKFRNFNEREGLQNLEYNLNAAYISPEKKIFLGGSKGVDYFSPDDLRTNIFVPPVVLSGLKIFDSSELPGMDDILKKDISVTSEIKLPHNYNSITINFAALDFSSPEKNQYSCILEGYEKNWRYLGTKNSMSYSLLRPGHYKFRVRGSNSDSVWNKKGLSLILIIKNPFTGSIWFKLMIIGIIMTLIALIIFFKNKSKNSPNHPDETVEQLFTNNIITEREKEIINLIMKGKSNKEIEDELFISLGTVKNHLYNIYKKLNIKSRTQLISFLKYEKKEKLIDKKNK